MREIEVKARVRRPRQLRAALAAADIRLGKPIVQHDVVYGPPGARGGQHANWLRIRTETAGGEAARIIFTLKRSVTGQLDSIEHEVVVDNAGELAAIIGCLGYTRYSDLTKTRRQGHAGNIALCLDELPGLGTFIEAERLCDEAADPATVTAALWQLLAPFGITPADEVTDGYDVLMRKQQGLA